MAAMDAGQAALYAGPSKIAKNRIELDRADRQLLRELQNNNKLTNAELADRVFVSAPTCLRRIRRLRDAKVIIGDRAIVDPDMIGPSLSAFIEVSLDRCSSEVQRKFERKMLATPQVRLCYRVAGPADFLIMVQVSNMCEYHDLLDTVLSADPDVKSVRSVIAVSRLKFTTSVPIEGI